MKKYILYPLIILIVIFFGKSMLPGNEMFDFHDVSQPGRIVEFSFDLQNGQIPPRIAPHMSYNMGYPVFNFYAPFSYWVTSLINLIGFDVADSLKISFLLAILLAFAGMYNFLKYFFKTLPSYFGAFLYSVSPYMAMEIFVRGNLAEVWFLALLPWTLYLLLKNRDLKVPYVFIGTTLLLSFILTVHNVLSLLFIPFVVLYILTLKDWRRNVISLGGAILIASYFYVPFILESNFTNAQTVAKLTNYTDHFLCWWQLWTTQAWGFGASNPGCLKDGMSFMLGKVQVICGLAGLLLFIFMFVKKNKEENRLTFLLIALAGIGSAFMATYSSEFIWDKVHSLAVFQFPWRFLSFALFALAFFSAYLFSTFKYSFLQVVIPFCLLFVFFSQSKYFYKTPLEKKQFHSYYTSRENIEDYVAYRVAEYLPAKGDYAYWRSVEDTTTRNEMVRQQTKAFLYPLDDENYKVLKQESFYKKAETTSSSFLLNVHYLPMWKIKINGQVHTPQMFDKLARPVVISSNNNKKTIELYFQQTPIQKAANTVSILGMIGTVVYAFFVLKNKHIKK